MADHLSFSNTSAFLQYYSHSRLTKLREQNFDPSRRVSPPLLKDCWFPNPSSVSAEFPSNSSTADLNQLIRVPECDLETPQPNPGLED